MMNYYLVTSFLVLFLSTVVQSTVVHDSFEIVPGHEPSAHVISVVDNTATNLAATAEFGPMGSPELMYSFTVSYDDSVINANEFTQRVIFSTCSDGTLFDTFLTLLNAQEGDTSDNMTLTSPDVYAAGSHSFNCDVDPMRVKAAGLVLDFAAASDVSELLFLVVEGYGNSEGQFNLSVTDCGSSCLQYDEFHSCSCRVCAAGFISQADGTCVVAACPEHMSSAPNCVPNEGYLMGNVTWDFEIEQWTGTPVVDCSTLNCADLNREDCFATPFTCGVCVAGYVNADWPHDSNEACVDTCFDPLCNECSTSLQNACVACAPGYLLLNGECSDGCPALAEGLWLGEVKLVASDGAADDNFGYSVAMSGSNLVVGAYYDDDAGSESGSAYVFHEATLDSGDWTQVAKLVASDAAADDYFGLSVAMSGSNLVVGAYADDDAGSGSGSAYVFHEATLDSGDWTQVAKLVASDAASHDNFGVSVAMSGSNLVVGAYADDDAGSGSGSAYVFHEATLDSGDWTQVAKLVASDGASGDYFGYSVAMAGSNLVVGAYYDDDAGSDSGSAYVFHEATLDSGDWTQVAKLVASDGAADDNFGVSVAMSGSNLVVGAYRDDDAGFDSGSACVFHEATLDSGDWTQVAKLVASDAAASDNFGLSVAMSGSNLVVGAYRDDDAGSDSGSAYVFDVDCTEPVFTSCPADILVYAVDDTTVNGLDVSATDVKDPNVEVICDPRLNTTFEFGVSTAVVCNATDISGNHAQCMFDVDVLPYSNDMTLECPVDTVTFSTRSFLLAEDLIDVVSASEYDMTFNSTALDAYTSLVTVSVVNIGGGNASCNFTVASHDSIWITPTLLVRLPVLTTGTISSTGDEQSDGSYLLGDGGLISFDGADLVHADDVTVVVEVGDLAFTNKSVCALDADLSNPGFITCEMPNVASLDGWSQVQNLHFRIRVITADDVTVTSEISSDVYHYPIKSHVSRVAGCAAQDGNVASACNTTNQAVTIFGQDFGLVTAVNVDDVPCTGIVPLNDTALTCILPDRAGTLKDVVAFQRAVASDRFPLVSYAEPTISTVSGCKNVGPSTTNCPTDGNVTLHVEGHNFGPVGAILYVGDALAECAESTHTTMQCTLPRGSGIDRPVLVLQLNGLLAYSKVATVSYRGCDNGKYEAADATCEPCSAGSYTNNDTIKTECVACPVGTYQPLNGSTTCLNCGDGEHQNATGQTTCSSCAIGKYSAGDTAKAECSQCEAGKYQPFYGSASCIECSAGAYQGALGKSACVNCETGRFSNNDTVKYYCTPCKAGEFRNETMSGDMCASCPAGRMSVAESADCDVCHSGKHSFAGSSECVQCSSDFEYAPREGMGECEECPSNAHRDDGSGNGTQCICNVEYFNTTMMLDFETVFGRKPTYPDDICRLCPVDFSCGYPGLDISTIFLTEGMWRESALHGTTTSCFSDASCPGGCYYGEVYPDDDSRNECYSQQAYSEAFTSGETSTTNVCEGNREGTLCAQCLPGYVADDVAAPCEKCVNSGLQVLFFILAGLAATIFCGYYVHKTLKKADKEKGEVSTLIKITLSAFQINSIAVSFAFVWEGAFNDFIAAESAASSLGTSALSFSCLTSSGDEDGLAAIYIETLLYLLSGVIVIVVPLVGMVPYLRYTSPMENPWPSVKQDVLDIFKVSLPIVFFLLHPTLTQRTMNLFHCTEIGDKLYLTQQLTEKCWQGDHLAWVFSAGVLMVAIYVVGLPLAGVLFLHRNLEKIHSDHPEHSTFHKHYSFLYKGYAVDTIGKDHYAWAWEAVVTSRKVFLMFILVFFANDAHLQSLLGLLGMIIALSTHAYALPFESSLLNAAEFISLLCSFVTFYLGQFTYVKDVEKSVRVGASYMALVVNVAFLVIMLGFVYTALKEKRDAKKQHARVQSQLASEQVEEDSKLGDLIVDRKRAATEEFRRYRAASHRRFHIRGNTVDHGDIEMTTIDEEGGTSSLKDADETANIETNIVAQSESIDEMKETTAVSVQAAPSEVSTEALKLPDGWTEHSSKSGKPYYYHAETEETTWTRPG